MLIETLQSLISSSTDRAPVDPFATLIAWLEDARASGHYTDANAMSLATSTTDGAPSVRIVLCKSLEPDTCSLTFFTNYHSRKGRELESNPRAAAVFHWPHAARQARIEGSIAKLTDEENDAYFRSRPLISQIGACASPQSSVIASRTALIDGAVKAAMSACLNTGVQRPKEWGGYRLHAHTIELWEARTGRLHERTRYRKSVGAEPQKQWCAETLAP
jgi:pyridoxamine 5'-phosphate oxidase